MRRLILPLAACLTLSACGGATEEAAVPTSIPPLARATADASSPASTSSTSSTPSPAKASGADQPATEITALPEKPAPSDKDKAYFAALAEKGIDSKGAEDQLLATATLICQAKASKQEAFTLPAIAGQLAEQGHTTLGVPEAQAALQAAATAIYCP